MSAPQHVTGDRADRVTVGQLVHLSPMVLGAPVPTSGWLTVSAVAVGEQVTLTFADDTSVTVAGNRLVRFGWN